MRLPFLLSRSLLAAAGGGMLLTSAALLSTSVFGSWRFLLGLTFHLAGQACFVGGLCLSGWLRQRRMRHSSHGAPQAFATARSLRPARFRPEVQVFRLLYGLVALVLLVSWLGMGAIGLRNLLRLRAYGVMTNATITGTTFREAGPILTVTYAFPVPGNLPVTDTFRAPRHLLPSLQTGNILPITYLPSNPAVHSWQKVDAGLVMRQCVSGLALFVTFAAYAGFPLLAIERRLRRQLQLARTGIGVTGTILTCKPLLRRNTRRGYLLTYTFATTDRQVVIGRALVPYIPDEPTLPGFPLTVLYDPARPGVCLPLAAFYSVELPNIRKSVLATG